jgi:hypothetical protein
VKAITDIHGLVENLETYVAPQNLLYHPVDLLVVDVQFADVLDLARSTYKVVERKAYWLNLGLT